MLWVSLVCLVVAVTALVFFVVNQFLFRRSAVVADGRQLPSVSIMIPARDEEAGIGDAIDRVLASQGVKFELIVLDDSSTDRTAEIVLHKSAADERLRLIRGGELPAGWCGKQHACWQLANAAVHDEFVFLDADVRISPDAIQRVIALRQDGIGNDASSTPSPIPLLGGFPKQVTGSLGEQLLTPLINYVLLCYLPFWVMRGSHSSSASAGCGQFFVTGRTEYFAAGGHQAIKESLHDGVRLPREYRKHQMTTDVFDAGDIASVRMYDGFAESFSGLMKNAVEGVANAKLIVPVSVLMVAAHVCPGLMLLFGCFVSVSPTVTAINVATVAVSLIPRFAIAARFDRAWLAAILHPVSIVVFLVIQWSAFIGHLFGRKSTWRGRTYSWRK